MGYIKIIIIITLVNRNWRGVWCACKLQVSVILDARHRKVRKTAKLGSW